MEMHGFPVRKWSASGGLSISNPYLMCMFTRGYKYILYTVYYTCQLLAVVPNSLPPKNSGNHGRRHFHSWPCVVWAQVPDEGTEKGGVQSRCPTRGLGGWVKPLHSWNPGTYHGISPLVGWFNRVVSPTIKIASKFTGGSIFRSV